MPPIYDPPTVGRTRIKGTDPRVRNVADRIGRGRRDVQAEQLGRGGMSAAAESAAQDDFAKRLNANTPSETRTDSAYERYKSNLPPKRPAPGKRETYYHETEARHAGSIREKGIKGSARTSFGEGEQVFARGRAPDTLGPERAYVEFEADPSRISGRGTMGSDAVSFRGSIPPEDVRGVHGHLPGGGIGRIADAGSTTMGLMSLIGQVAQFIPGFSERMPRTTWLANGGPIGDLLQSVIAGNYAPGGVMDPYRDMRDMPGFNPNTGTVPA